MSLKEIIELLGYVILDIPFTQEIDCLKIPVTVATTFKPGASVYDSIIVLDGSTFIKNLR